VVAQPYGRIAGDGGEKSSCGRRRETPRLPVGVDARPLDGGRGVIGTQRERPAGGVVADDLLHGEGVEAREDGEAPRDRGGGRRPDVDAAAATSIVGRALGERLDLGGDDTGWM